MAENHLAPVLRRPEEGWESEGEVSCDEWCGALRDPKTDEEIARAYEHWRWHGLMDGCSHGS